MREYFKRREIMEGKFKKGKEVLVEKLELPKDVILDIPKIIVMGRNEITIENHKGIQIFEKNKIKINTIQRIKKKRSQFGSSKFANPLYKFFSKIKRGGR